MCLIGKMQLLCMQCRGIGPHLVARGKSHGLFRVAAGTYSISSSKMGMPILNGSLFSEVRTPIYVRQTPREAMLGLVGQYGRTWR